MRQGTEAPLLPLSQITAYVSRWRFIGRVTKKNVVRQFKYKAKEGDGQLFSAEIVDRDGTEARVTFFGQAVDMFYEMLEERHMYSFSGGRVKAANKQWCSCEIEITFDERGQIVRVTDDANCPQIICNPRPIAEINPTSGTVDVVAIVSETELAVDVNTKLGTRRRVNITLLDDSGASIRMSIWGEGADTPFPEGSVVIATKCKVSDFGGCSLTTNFGSSVLIGDLARAAHPRAAELTAWFGAQGDAAKQSARALSTSGGGGVLQTIAELRADANNLEWGAIPGSGPNGVLYSTVMPATITFLSYDRQPFYLACPAQVVDERASEKAGESKTRACNKKVEQTAQGWMCAANHCSPEPCPRWMGRFAIADPSGTQYVSAFDEVCQKVFNLSAGECRRLWDEKETSQEAFMEFENVFKAAQYRRWKLRVRVKKEMWNEEERIKVEAVDCAPVEFVSDGRAKLKEALTAVGSDVAAFVGDAPAGAMLV